MTLVLQQTSQTLSSLTFAFGGSGASNPEPGLGGDGAAPTDRVLTRAARTAEDAAVVIDALRSAVRALRDGEADALDAVRAYRDIGRSRRIRDAEPLGDRGVNPSADLPVAPERQRISQTFIQGEGLTASLVSVQTVAVGPGGPMATSRSFGEVSLEFDDFDMEITFSQTARLNRGSGEAEAARYGEITLSGEGFELTLGFEQRLALGPDGPSASFGRFAEFAVSGDGFAARSRIAAIAGFDPSGIHVSAHSGTALAAGTESGAAAVEILRQLQAYLAPPAGDTGPPDTAVA